MCDQVKRGMSDKVGRCADLGSTDPLQQERI
jgi:hypothetical protein